jgi:protein-S-isoprenylcysteine O-methyltransferase Ste14
MVEAAIRIVVSVPLLALLFFLPAGRWDWRMGWALIGVMVVLVCINMAALMVVRTALEERMLRNELGGYEAYAQRVRYRLIPGVW